MLIYTYFCTNIGINQHILYMLCIYIKLYWWVGTNVGIRRFVKTVCEYSTQKKDGKRGNIGSTYDVYLCVLLFNAVFNSTIIDEHIFLHIKPSACIMVLVNRNPMVFSIFTSQTQKWHMCTTHIHIKNI